MNSGYKLVGNAQYPQMVKDFERTFPDAEFPALRHLSGGAWQLLRVGGEISRLKKGGANPFVDPAGYNSYVADWEKAFRAELWRQEKQ
jgi:metallo-beta-lactamase class B